MLIMISSIIFIVSVLGMIIILGRKIPVLVELPEVAKKPRVGFVSKIKDRTKNITFEKYLHKILSKIRVLTLKTDNKTYNWLQKLRQKSKERQEKFSDDYWKKLKGKE